MSLDENCAVMRQIQAENRRRLYARLDRALQRRTDALGDLYRRGLDASATIRAERQAHRLSAKRYTDTVRPYLRWRPVCTCGWVGRGTVTREHAESRARDERDHLFSPLRAPQHSQATA